MAILFLSKILRFLGVIFFIFSIPFIVLAARYPFNDPFLSEQWYLDAIHVPQTPPEGKETIVAILDAGFDMSHEDLAHQYWINNNEIAGDHKDNDHNGYEDDISGWDFVDRDFDPSPDVSNQKTDDTIASHGTLLAGIIAAQVNNKKGIIGIAPKAKIMPLRILDAKGKGNSTDVREAIEYAVKNGADVINISFTSTQPDDRLQKTIQWAFDQGVVVVAAVGNESSDTEKIPTYPACFDMISGKNTVIGVAATNQDNKKADFSNQGKNCVDISAPGVNIFGLTYHDSSQLLFSTAYGSPFEGTSMAAPMVSAAVARIKSAYPTLTPNQIRLILMLSADPSKETTLPARQGLGAGILNIERAIKTAAVFAGEGKSIRETQSHQSGSLVIAQGKGTVPLVKRFNQYGKEIMSFFAYNQKFRGGVRLAMGDVNGDGTEEIVTGAGPGGGPHVRVFDLNGSLINQFYSFETDDRQGIFVTTADVNRDGIDEIIVTPDQGGNGQVRIFNQRGEMQGAFYPFGRTQSAVHVAVGNFDDDPEAEIVATLSGHDKDHRVRIFDANGRYVREFTALDMTKTGLRVSAVRRVNQQMDDIVISSDTGSSPWLVVYSATGEKKSANLAYSPNFLGGVSLAVGDIDGNGNEEIYTVPIYGGGPHVRIFNVTTDLIGGFFAFDLKSRSGLSVAIWNP